MCLPHLPRISPGKESSEDTAAPHPVLYSLLKQVCRGAWDCWVRTRKPRGRVRLSISRVLVGPGMMHAPTPVARLKTKQRARQHAPHDSSNINQIRVFEHPITRPTRTGRANAHEPYQRWLWAWLPPFLFPPRSRFSCSPLPQCRLSQDARVLPLSSGHQRPREGTSEPRMHSQR